MLGEEAFTGDCLAILHMLEVGPSDSPVVYLRVAVSAGVGDGVRIPLDVVGIGQDQVVRAGEVKDAFAFVVARAVAIAAVALTRVTSFLSDVSVKVCS